MLTLDGSTLEGGGQLTRMALCLSAITGIPIRIHSIRAGRGSKSFAARRDGYSVPAPSSSFSKSNAKSGGGGRHRERNGENGRRGGGKRGEPAATGSGGLKESHLAALHWLAKQVNARVDGDEIGSREVIFRPDPKYYQNMKNRVSQHGAGGNKSNDDDDDEGVIRDRIVLQRPGSVWLIFQAIFPFMVFNSCSYRRSRSHPRSNDEGEEEEKEKQRLLYDITLVGGTNVPSSMSTEYVTQVFLPMCERIGLPRVEIETVKRGWTTGAVDVGEVRVKMYATIDRGSDSDLGTDTNTDTGSGGIPRQGGQDGRWIKEPFTLPSFQLSSVMNNNKTTTNLEESLPPTTSTSTSTSAPGGTSPASTINITILSPSYQQPEILNFLTTFLTQSPLFQTLNPPPDIQIHPSSSPPLGNPLAKALPPPPSSPTRNITNRDRNSGETKDFDRRLYVLLTFTPTGFPLSVSVKKNGRNGPKEEPINSPIIGRDYLGTLPSTGRSKEKQDELLAMAMEKLVREFVGDCMEVCRSHRHHHRHDHNGDGDGEENDEGEEKEKEKEEEKKTIIMDEHLTDQLIVFQALSGYSPPPSVSFSSLTSSSSHHDTPEHEREKQQEQEKGDVNKSILGYSLGGGGGGGGGDHTEKATKEHEDQKEGDPEGSLHTRTVRWVCEQILGDMGCRFERGGRGVGVGWCSAGRSTTITSSTGDISSGNTDTSGVPGRTGDRNVTMGEEIFS